MQVWERAFHFFFQALCLMRQTLYLLRTALSWKFPISTACADGPEGDEKQLHNSFILFGVKEYVINPSFSGYQYLELTSTVYSCSAALYR